MPIARFVVALSVALAGGFAPSGHAGLVVVNNRFISTDPALPYLPNDRSECEGFRDTVQETRQEVSKAHDACLAQNRGSSGSSDGALFPGGAGRCSVSACQELHTARDQLSRAVAEGYSQCMAEVRARSSRQDDDFRRAIGGLRATELGAARKLVRAKLNEIIDAVFGHGSPLVKGGIKAAGITQRVWGSASELRQTCHANGKREIARECDREIVAAIDDFSTRVPLSVRGDPAIGAIQIGLRERVVQLLGEYADTDGLFRDMDAITESPARGRRPGAVIENR